MGDRSRERDAALTELRERLDDGLALARLSKTQLAVRTNLSRTTVQEAFNAKAPVPSPGTIVALARALGLPESDLLELRRTAAGETSVSRGTGEVLGRPIRDWNAHDLEVHPAGPGNDYARAPVLSSYVPRAHDRMLADAVSAAVDGHSQMIVLVGASSTGKTRACWEAVQPLASKGWRLWHPFNPTRAEAARDALAQVGPYTIVWLNEAQHYLGDPGRGERIAANIHALLTSPARGPVLVLGTLWPEYARRYTTPPTPGSPDPHSRVREIVAGRLVTVPDSFDEKALQEATARAEAGDSLLADALTRARNSGRVAQDLAGAPQLLDRYQTASPAAKAVLEAAMDARRLGVGLHLPQKFLTDAAIDYLSDDDYDSIQHIIDWEQQALVELAEPVHGKHAPLRPAGPRPKRRPPGSPPLPPREAEVGPVFRLADYLEQHGRITRRRYCPPASFWSAAHAHLTYLGDLTNLSEAATARHRLQWAHHLYHHATHFGLPATVSRRAAETVAQTEGAVIASNVLFESGIARMQSGDLASAEELLRQAADVGHIRSLGALALLQAEMGNRQKAEAFARQAAEAGYPKALRLLVEHQEKEGDRESAEVLARQLADAGDPGTLHHLAQLRMGAGDLASAEELLRQAADVGHIRSLGALALLQAEMGNRQKAEAFARQAAEAGYPKALRLLVEHQEKEGDRESAEVLARQLADAGHPGTLWLLAEQREEAEDQQGAEALVQQLADAGYVDAPRLLMERREEAGDPASGQALSEYGTDNGQVAISEATVVRVEDAGYQDKAEALARQIAEEGDPVGPLSLAVLRAKAGDMAGAEVLFQQAADAGDADALRALVVLRERAGDRQSAEALARQAAEAGRPQALRDLAVVRARAGDSAGAEVLFRQAANAGHPYALRELARWRDEAGDRTGAETLARQAAGTNAPDALRALARWREQTGDQSGAASLYREAADAGDSDALMDLAVLREKAGNNDEVVALYREAADAGNAEALRVLIWRREAKGDLQGVEVLYREAADAGNAWLFRLELDARWPNGLDPDGTPSASWD